MSDYSHQVRYISLASGLLSAAERRNSACESELCQSRDAPATVPLTFDRLADKPADPYQYGLYF